MKLWNHSATDAVIGFFVTIGKSPDRNFHASVKRQLHRCDLEITVPDGLDKFWHEGIYVALMKAQGPYPWPVRFSYENVTQYITMQELAWIERKMKTVPIHVYDAPVAQESVAANNDHLRQLQNKINQVRYNASKA